MRRPPQRAIASLGAHCPHPKFYARVVHGFPYQPGAFLPVWYPMKDVTHPTDVAARITVRIANFTLADDLRSSMTDRVARVANAEPQIERVSIELSRDENADENHRFVAKAQIDFGGPAMFTTVAARDASLAVEFLIGKLEQRLRRQRVPTAKARAATPSTSETPKPVDQF